MNAEKKEWSWCSALSRAFLAYCFQTSRSICWTWLWKIYLWRFPVIVGINLMSLGTVPPIIKCGWNSVFLGYSPISFLTAPLKTVFVAFFWAFFISVFSLAYYAVFSQTFHMNRNRFSEKVNKVSYLPYDTDFFEDWQEASWESNYKEIPWNTMSTCEQDGWLIHIKEKIEKKDGWMARASPYLKSPFF